MTRFRRLTEFTLELTKWARVLGNEAVVAVREIQWTRKKKLLATGIGCCGILLSAATWSAFRSLENSFETPPPGILSADQLSLLTAVDDSSTTHAPLQVPPVRDNSISPALHVGEQNAASQIQQAGSTGLVQTAQVVTTAAEPRGAWLIGTIEFDDDSAAVQQSPEQAANSAQTHSLPPTSTMNYNQPLLVIPEGP